MFLCIADDRHASSPMRQCGRRHEAAGQEEVGGALHATSQVDSRRRKLPVVVVDFCIKSVGCEINTVMCTIVNALDKVIDAVSRHLRSRFALSALSTVVHGPQGSLPSWKYSDHLCMLYCPMHAKAAHELWRCSRTPQRAASQYLIQSLFAVGCSALLCLLCMYQRASIV